MDGNSETKEVQTGNPNYTQFVDPNGRVVSRHVVISPRPSPSPTGGELPPPPVRTQSAPPIFENTSVCAQVVDHQGDDSLEISPDSLSPSPIHRSTSDTTGVRTGIRIVRRGDDDSPPPQIFYPSSPPEYGDWRDHPDAARLLGREQVGSDDENGVSDRPPSQVVNGDLAPGWTKLPNGAVVKKKLPITTDKQRYNTFDDVSLGGNQGGERPMTPVVGSVSSSIQGASSSRLDGRGAYEKEDSCCHCVVS